MAGAAFAPAVDGAAVFAVAFAGAAFAAEAFAAAALVAEGFAGADLGAVAFAAFGDTAFGDTALGDTALAVVFAAALVVPPFAADFGIAAFVVAFAAPLFAAAFGAVALAAVLLAGVFLAGVAFAPATFFARVAFAVAGVVFTAAALREEGSAFVARFPATGFAPGLATDLPAGTFAEAPAFPAPAAGFFAPGTKRGRCFRPPTRRAASAYRLRILRSAAAFAEVRSMSYSTPSRLKPTVWAAGRPVRSSRTRTAVFLAMKPPVLDRDHACNRHGDAPVPPGAAGFLAAV